jgi:hypothetical protein
LQVAVILLAAEKIRARLLNSTIWFTTHCFSQRISAVEWLDGNRAFKFHPQYPTYRAYDDAQSSSMDCGEW